MELSDLVIGSNQPRCVCVCFYTCALVVCVWAFLCVYRVEVSLVELVHSSLQLTALGLPLFEVAD